MSNYRLVEYCLDSDIFIESNKGLYAPDIVPGFWDLLDQQTNLGIIASSTEVYEEIVVGTDNLVQWVIQRENSGLFAQPDVDVQASFTQIANYVDTAYELAQSEIFLSGADPWIVSHAIAHGGKIVTFERRVPQNSTKIKIPNLCDVFGIASIRIE